MNNYILKYNQINESNEFDNLSFEETGRLIELGIIDHPDLIKIYDYVKNGSIGDLDLHNSKLEYLPNWLAIVNGDLNIEHSDILDIPESLIIKGSIYARYSKLKEFRRTVVYGHLDIDYSQITKLPDNLRVDGYLSVEGVQFEEIPKNLEISRGFHIDGSNLEQLSDEELRKMYKKWNNL